MSNGKDTLKVAGILFFDVKGYSVLSGPQMEGYHAKVWPVLHEIATKKHGRNDTKEYFYMNTWGDGIVLVHEDHWKLANVALEWRDYFDKMKYISDADPVLHDCELTPRIAIHVGEFHIVDDPFQKRVGCFGKEIVRAARIEPCTEPGHVWVTPDVKSFVEKREKEEGTDRLGFIDQGEQELAKQFDTDRIFEITYKKDAEAKNPKKKTKKVVNMATAQPPEEKEAIDADTAKKIKALTNEDPLDNDPSVCSITRQPVCPAKLKTLEVIAELVEHGKEARDELEAAIAIRALEKSATEMVEAYKRRTIDITHVAALDRDARCFLDCFDTSVDKAAAERFLEKKSLIPGRAKEARSFVESVRKFRDQYANTTDWYENGEFNLEATGRLIRNCLLDILKDAGSFAGSLKDTGLSRMDSAREAVEEGFAKFDRYWFVCHLKEVISKLLSKCRHLPPVWSS